MKTFQIRGIGQCFPGVTFSHFCCHTVGSLGGVVSFDKVVIDLASDTCQTGVRHSGKEMFLNNSPSIGGVMKCYKGAAAQRHWKFIS